MAAVATLLHNTKFEELCRLCGSKTDMLAVHIFDDEGTFSELGKKIYNCLQLQIHQQDELPKLLCDNCLVKLEMFWDFKDRSFRTEQLLIELYKQLKNGSNHQQCVVAVDANGMILQVSNDHQLLPSDDLANSSSDYAVILPHDDLQGAHLDGLDLANRDLSNDAQQSMAVLPSPHNLNLMEEQLLNDNELGHNLQCIESDNTIYTGNVSIQPESEQNYPKDAHKEDSLDYLQPKSIDPSLSDNSLGVDSHFERMMSYSSDSQMDKMTAGQEEESDSKPSDVNNVAQPYLLDDDVMENSRDLADLSTFEARADQLVDHHFLKCESDFGRVIINFKDDISLDSMDAKNEDSNSLSHSSGGSPQKPQESKSGQKVCSICGKSYKSNYKLAQHMTKHTGERPYKCGSCDKAFRSKIGLTQHEAKHTGRYELSCPTCGKGFQCKSYLMVHQRVHSDLKPYPCTTCGINFKTKQSLLDHTNRHLGVKPFACSICKRGFITKSLCTAHERTHAGVDNRKYSCKTCHKRFVSKSYLQTHSRIHTGEKTFICEVCGKGFLTRVDLKIHLTMHTGEKSYVCEMCGKAFARRDALKCHRRMHTGERPYRCDVCGRTFTQFSPMAIHRRHHTGEKPFSCETCGKTFAAKSTMVSHQKKHEKSDGKVEPEEQTTLTTN